MAASGHQHPATIARHKATLSDPALYAKDPKHFAAITAEQAETRWLERAEKDAALG